MGDVIKDFYNSDAPQFKGKSKKKRREMAIAAKLSAEESFEIDPKKHRTARRDAKIGNLARKTTNPGEKTAAERKQKGPKLAFEGWKERASDAIKRVVKKKEAPKHDYGRDAGAIAAKKLRKKDHEKVNFLDPDD